MILFKGVKFRNILSSGNGWTEIDLNTHKSTLIVGENGAGKSTMLDAICFGLYGKPFRKINKNQLVNSINQKALEVHVEFDVGRHSYKVIRGIKPNIFEVWKDGEMLNQDSSTRDYQEYLEESILKMNIKSFGQVVVLGSSTFVPFMQLTAAARREVIEDLLDIQIFTLMKSLLKDRVNENTENVTKIRHKLQIEKNNLSSSMAHNLSIKNLMQGQVDKLIAKGKEKTKDYEDEKAAAQEVQVQFDNLSKTISDKLDVSDNKAKLEASMRKLDIEEEGIRKELAFYEDHDSCPTCKQGITEHTKKGVEKHCLDRLREIDSSRSTLNREMELYDDRLKEIHDVETQLQGLRSNLLTHTTNMSGISSLLKSIKRELVEAKTEVQKIDESNLISIEDEIRRLTKQEAEELEHRDVLSVVAAMLKDGGIKTSVVKQYIPVMNTLINKYLSQMDFFVKFELDENFNETIKSRFRDVFSYSSFSEGEKLRIDLALLFTWRAVAKMRNSVSTNLLIMDEIMDSSLDDAGTDEFLRIINDLTVDTNVFIISHKGEQLHDKFERVMKFKKVKNYSILENNA